MEKLLIKGGKPLKGEITISASKNSVVGVIPATILAEGKCVIENIPAISDVSVILSILQELGASVRYIDKTTVEIDTSCVNSYCATSEMVTKMRASYYLMGALLGRFNHAIVSMPGGCDLGGRPIDQHLRGFRLMGAEITETPDCIDLNTDQLLGTHFSFDVVTVGATINVMLAAVRAQGITIIENPAREPHVVDVANILNAMGANIKGAGTDVIKIKGVESLHGGITHPVIPDYVECGTYMLMAAATGGEVLIHNVIPKHMESVTSKIREIGGIVVEYDDTLFVKGPAEIVPTRVTASPYPGFPTDVQPLIVTLLSIANGTSTLSEAVWANRFQYIPELMKFGADVSVNGNTATINGVKKLHAAKAKCTDLRGGAAMVMAALMADGISEIHELRHIDRGYESLVEKLRALGADIRRVNDDSGENKN